MVPVEIPSFDSSPLVFRRRTGHHDAEDLLVADLTASCGSSSEGSTMYYNGAVVPLLGHFAHFKFPSGPPGSRGSLERERPQGILSQEPRDAHTQALEFN
jgi:hypothetical protein